MKKDEYWSSGVKLTDIVDYQKSRIKKSDNNGLCTICKKSPITNTLLKRCSHCSIYCN